VFDHCFARQKSTPSTLVVNNALSSRGAQLAAKSLPSPRVEKGQIFDDPTRPNVLIVDDNHINRRVDFHDTSVEVRKALMGRSFSLYS